MKKALLIIVAILAVTFFLGNAEMVQSFLETIGSGTTVPLIFAVFFMIVRHLTQAASYDAAFEAAGYKTGFKHNVCLIFSLVFINTFCLFSGATGLAFIIDDARRKGADLGTATSGGLLSQIGFFAAVFFISVISTIVMVISDSLNMVIVAGFLMLAAVLFGQSAFFFIGYYKPDWLYALLGFVEKAVNAVLRLFKKSLREAWATSTADQFIDSSRILAHNPKGVVLTIAWASLSAVMNLSCLICIGFAFDFQEIAPLVASFGVAVVSIMLSPTPQGIGVTEAAITVILTAAGSSVATAAAIALVYRGIMLWIPFLVGAIMLSQSGFFKSKKTPTEESKAKDVGWITGTLVGLMGLVNIVLAVAAPALAPYGILTQFVDLHGLLVGQSMLVAGVVLLICAIGLILRYRVVWALSIAMLSIIGGLELFFETYTVAIPVIILAIVLVAKRDAFDRSSPLVKLTKERNERRMEAERKAGKAVIHKGGIASMSATLDDLKRRSDRVEDRERRRARKKSETGSVQASVSSDAVSAAAADAVAAEEPASR